MADLVIVSASVQKATGANATRIEPGISGEALLAGEVVYLKSSDQRIYKADANVTAAEAIVKGVLLNSAPGAGQPVDIATGGDLNPGATVGVGTIYGLSATAGKIAVYGSVGGADGLSDLVSGMRVSVLGVGTTASNIRLSILNSGAVVP